jgi:hypothetical protein
MCKNTLAPQGLLPGIVPINRVIKQSSSRQGGYTPISGIRPTIVRLFSRTIPERVRICLVYLGLYADYLRLYDWYCNLDSPAKIQFWIAVFIGVGVTNLVIGPYISVVIAFLLMLLLLAEKRS